MKLLMIMLMGVACLAAACAGSDATSLGPAPTDTPSQSHSSTPSPPASPTPTGTTNVTPSPNRTYTYQVWFVRAGKLFPTKRTEPFTVALGQLSLNGLLAGPSTVERAAGVSTDVPAGTTFDITALSNGQATVQADPGFIEGASATALRLRQAQAVYTLTQFATITRVQFTSAGGIVSLGPKGRADFDVLLPAIVVESPQLGSRVSDPVTVSGTADVFEATVSIRILDASGHEIARTFTQAACGTGCRGDFSASLGYQISSEQQGTLEVFENSAKDGSPINVVSIPVTLTP
jgi:hypothetical protein